MFLGDNKVVFFPFISLFKFSKFIFCSSVSVYSVTVPRAPITIGVIVIFMIRRVFNSLTRSRYLSLFSRSFNFTMWSAGTAKSTILQVLFFVEYYKIWSSGWDLVIRLYLEISEEFVYLILQDRCWVVHIPFVCMVKLQLPAQFPVDHLANSVVPSLIFFLW